MEERKPSIIIAHASARAGLMMFGSQTVNLTCAERERSSPLIIIMCTYLLDKSPTRFHACKLSQKNWQTGVRRTCIV